MPRSVYTDLPSDEIVDRVYHDDVDEYGDDDNDFVANGAGGSNRSTGIYSSIRTDEEELQSVIRRRRPPPPSTNTNQRSRSSTCTCLCMSLLVLMILTVAGIVMARIGFKLFPLDTSEQDPTDHQSSTSSGSTNTWGRSWFHPKSTTDNSSVSTSAEPSINNETNAENVTTASVKAIPSGNQGSVHYDPDAALHYYNPFNFKQGDWYGSVALPPTLGDTGLSNSRLGYLSQPNLVGQHLVFVTEGDVYYTHYSTTERTVAFKLTTTVGNARSPTINPQFPYLVAYTATYTGHREVYVMDMRPSKGYAQAAIRLTYWDTSYGVNRIVGWKDGGNTLVFSAQCREAGLPDTRLYQIVMKASLASNTANSLQVLEVSPIPLSQAIDGIWDNDCVFFTRFQQSSNTLRYVGGTAESLWAWCDGETEAVPLTSDYEGTSKSPKIVASPDGTTNSLLFMSDRNIRGVHQKGKIAPSTMNLFASPLPSRKDLYDRKDQTYYTIMKPLALSQVSCSNLGLGLREYTVDGDIAILRVGADLHMLTSISSKSRSIKPLDIVVYSDFHEHQERLLPVSVTTDMTSVDVYTTSFGSTAALLGMRGQLFVAPVLPDSNQPAYAGAGMNLPPRRYRVVPGMTMGGVVRVLCASFVPMPQENGKTTRRLAVILATDPTTETAEHAFYLIETQSDSAPSFVGKDELPQPFLGGGTETGGSVALGGLGSVDADTVTVSPCGRRMAWTDTDGRICVMTMPMYQAKSSISPTYKVLPNLNENGEPIVGIGVDLMWSPGGRYLAINHSARNQFLIISIADCGDPNIEGTEEVADIKIDRIVQATPARFNSESPFWGRTAMDQAIATQTSTFAILMGKKPPVDPGGATTLYFLSDRDVVSDVQSPWGTRAPSPHFVDRKSVYALPLVLSEPNPLNPMNGRYAGGGAAELWADGMIDLQLQLMALEAAAPVSVSHAASPNERHQRRLDPQRFLVAAEVQQGVNDHHARDLLQTPSPTTSRPGSIANANPTTATAQQPTVVPILQSSTAPTRKPSTSIPSTFPSEVPSTSMPSTLPSSAPSQAKISPIFPNDNEICFGPLVGLDFARKAYRIAGIPAAPYKLILCQVKDDPSLILIESTGKGAAVKLMATEDFPSDKIEEMTLFDDIVYRGSGVSTDGEHLIFILSKGRIKVVPNTATSVLRIPSDTLMERSMVDAAGMAVMVWPSLEYRQMYNDAWRMLRDYFYDTNMHGVDWPSIHSRYSSLISRCSKREELDDVLAQMASELSALHVFVYGGEYNDPMHGDDELADLHEVASLGATFQRSLEYNGFIVTSIATRDPDFNLIDRSAIYSPLSSQVLELSGQRGLNIGDVIVGVNGESVMRVPDLSMLLRGTAGRSVRLDVIRQPLEVQNPTDFKLEPVITVPLSQTDADNLRYAAWEWKSLQLAKSLAAAKNFTVGYVHLRSMEGPEDIDAFTRGFFSDFDKQALIIDVRHNRGGNIDSWLLNLLQRRAWMYWQGRATNVHNGGLGWDQQFAFRGHLVVLIDEKSSSDAEGFARGVAELGLGKLVGTRTWGGGIWLSSDNHLVDGGIATAPEVGTYNTHFGWGLGIEQQGVEPDVHVDNNPRLAYDGIDSQMIMAIDVLDKWLSEEPVVLPKDPGAKPDLSLHSDMEMCS